MGRIDSETETFIPTLTHALKGEGHDASEDGTGRGVPLVPVAFSCKDHGGDALAGVSPTLRAMNHSGSHANAGGQVAVAFAQNQRDEVRTIRRLLPVECERLQGFPDGHTEVTHRGKPAADGPRYKAIGNSKAVPVVRWIGKRILRAIEATK